MAASIGLISVRILIFKLSYFICDFNQVYGRLHGLIRACMSDSHAYKVAVCFNDVHTEGKGETNTH